ncbi:glycosyltransferase [Endozoicomonas sp. OPT23]|uniref:glycosyltransferase n=1 Tax=Endozoicomonas sp. OPT23 TaxID=2072845 RepID=UPI00129B766E|nr:glycosyltransferase [Endozoicomonas sp. OPT23]MRI31607.1 glycosyltransferase [Endozoicomonas sp. OPT23]
MTDKTILQICHSYNPPFLDIAKQYATAIRLAGYKVTTVYIKGDEDSQIAEESCSDHVIFLKNSSKDIRGLKRKQIKQIKKICENEDYNFIIAHRFKSIYIANKATNIPVFGVHHCFGDYKRLTRRLHAYRYKNKLSLLGVSNAIRDDLRLSLPGFSEKRIHTLYNAIDYERLRSNQVSTIEARAYLGLPENKYIFANVGRLHPDKDQFTLIKGYAKVCQEESDSILVILGTGELEQELKALTETLGVRDRVLFLGMVKDAQVYFKAFDSFVLTSDREPFGMVLLEAMTAGLPTIISNCGGAPEVVGPHARSFTFGDANELAKEMINVYQTSEKEKISAASFMIDRIKDLFTYKAISVQLKAIINKT